MKGWTEMILDMIGKIKIIQIDLGALTTHIVMLNRSL